MSRVVVRPPTPYELESRCSPGKGRASLGNSCGATCLSSVMHAVTTSGVVVTLAAVVRMIAILSAPQRIECVCEVTRPGGAVLEAGSVRVYRVLRCTLCRVACGSRDSG